MEEKVLELFRALSDERKRAFVEQLQRLLQEQYSTPDKQM